MRIRNILNHLRACRGREVDRALAAAIPTADPRSFADLTELALEQRRDVLIAALIEHFGRLSTGHQHELKQRAAAGALDAPLRLAVARRGAAATRAVRLIADAAAGRLAYLIADQLRHGGASDRAVAGQCLLLLTERTIDQADARTLADLISAVTEAVAVYRHHHQPDALAALLLLAAQPDSRIVMSLTDLRDPAVMTLRERLPDDEAAQPSLLAWLRSPALASTAADAVARHAQKGGLSEILQPWPLLLIGQVAAGLARCGPHAALLANLAVHLAKADGANRGEGASGATDHSSERGSHTGGTGGTGGDRGDVNERDSHLAGDAGEPRSPIADLNEPGSRADSSLAAAADADADAFADAIPGSASPAASAVPLWLTCLPLGVGRQVELLTDLAEAPSRAVRLAALRRLIALGRSPGDAVNRAVATFCDDAEPAIVRVAVRYLAGAGYVDLNRLLLRLTHSPDASVRQLAATRLAPVGFDWLWQAWPKLNVTQRISAARAVIKIDPRFHHRIDRRLRGPERKEKLQALAMIDQLHQGVFYEPALLRLARGPDTTLAASAVKALGSVATQPAVDVLEASLAHSDKRVRANAIEALAQLRAMSAPNSTGETPVPPREAGQVNPVGQAMPVGRASRPSSPSRPSRPKPSRLSHTNSAAKLKSIAAHDANRPRANAIAALLSVDRPAALATLDAMLADGQRDHRVSALWLIGQGGLINAASKVGELAVSDPDPKVRRRARQTLGELVAQLQRPIVVKAKTDDSSDDVLIDDENRSREASEAMM